MSTFLTLTEACVFLKSFLNILAEPNERLICVLLLLELGLGEKLFSWRRICEKKIGLQKNRKMVEKKIKVRMLYYRKIFFLENEQLDSQ